jgi:hypothetical protein
MMRALHAIFAFALAVTFAGLFVACSNGDDYLYDEDQSTFIEVSAEMAFSFDSSSTRMKSDTLTPADTLIFIANILPSKSIKIKRYLWTMDGETLSYDFSFRKSIEAPGLHKIVFFLETYLGDTLSDTLSLLVSNLPVLDENKFIPAPHSQGLPISGGVSFAWEAYDPDSIASLHYRFTIEGIVDTVVPDQGFTYWGDLPPLEHLQWSVQAINEFGFASREKIHGDFFTRGGTGEAGVTGAVTTSAANGTEKFEFSVNATVLDSLGQVVLSKDIASNSLATRAFSISPLSAGAYRIAFNVPEYPDFDGDTLSFALQDGEVRDLDTITLHDTTPPSIAVLIAGNALTGVDTLDYTDTLQFLIRDLGTKKSRITTSVYLESTLLTEKTISGDTLTVILPATARGWNSRLLDIVATDASKNKTVQNYTIEGSDSWFKTNPNPTVITGDSIRLYIIDNNHYGFKPDTFYIKTRNKYIAQYADDSPIFGRSFLKLEFDEGDNIIHSGVRYTNGITQWKRWTLTRPKSSGGTP